MLVDQSVEVVYMDRVLGSVRPNDPDLRGNPYVCELVPEPGPVALEPALQ